MSSCSLYAAKCLIFWLFYFFRQRHHPGDDLRQPVAGPVLVLRAQHLEWTSSCRSRVRLVKTILHSVESVVCGIQFSLGISVDREFI